MPPARIERALFPLLRDTNAVLQVERLTWEELVLV